MYGEPPFPEHEILLDMLVEDEKPEETPKEKPENEKAVRKRSRKG
jgi:hypothetical protein